jgi:hypothetical protein
MWGARTHPRFGSTRHVASAEGGGVSPQSTAIGMAQTHHVPTQLWIWPASLKVLMTIPHAPMTQPKPSLTSPKALMTLLMVLVTFHRVLVTSLMMLVASHIVSETIPNMSETILFVLVTLLKPLERSPRRWTSFHGNLLQFFAPMPLFRRQWTAGLCKGHGSTGNCLSFARVAGILPGIKFVKIRAVRVQARPL